MRAKGLRLPKRNGFGPTLLAFELGNNGELHSTELTDCQLTDSGTANNGLMHANKVVLAVLVINSCHPAALAKTACTGREGSFVAHLTSGGQRAEQNVVPFSHQHNVRATVGAVIRSVVVQNNDTGRKDGFMWNLRLVRAT